MATAIFKYAYTTVCMVIQGSGTLPEELSEIEKTALIALADACNWSPTAHPPIEAVTRRVPSHLRGDLKKAVEKKLKKNGYCTPHPTAGGITWYITKVGLERATDILKSRT